MKSTRIGHRFVDASVIRQRIQRKDDREAAELRQRSQAADSSPSTVIRSDPPRPESARWGDLGTSVPNVPDSGASQSEQDDCDDEALREQRWDAFVNETQRWVALIGWTEILNDVVCAYRASLAPDNDSYGPGRFAWHVLQFQESEGWSGVLSAIARVQREKEGR